MAYTTRLRKEYMLIQKSPPPFITAKPLESNLLEWHYIIQGPPDSPYAGGEYWGKLIFPKEYPYKPPAIQMVTPSGRFETSRALCLSMSSFHPETWCPGWSVSSVLIGLLSFMLEDTITNGSITTTAEEKRAFAAASAAYNRSQSKFREVFPDVAPPSTAMVSTTSPAPVAVTPVTPAPAPVAVKKRR
ncbi:ubiquitin-conjugating enzyme/RWD-like protein [Zopfochytrium polystomum]|nr:ubiquitin-conjugating enzyme/RWD-like protein [Zopfochytrium polystomum]